MVGLFWIVNDNIEYASTSIINCKPGWLMNKSIQNQKPNWQTICLVHYELNKEYTEKYPRGRVVYDSEFNKYIIVCNKKCLEYKKQLLNIFDIKEAEFVIDKHYDL